MQMRLDGEARDRRAEAADRQLRLDREAADKRIEAADRQSRLDREAADKRIEAAAAQAKLDRDVLLQQMKLDKAESERLSKLDRDAMLAQLASLTRQTDNDGTRRTNDSDRRSEENMSFSARLSRAGKITRLLLYNMPTNNQDVIAYLSEVDRVFAANNIDADLRVNLLTQYVNTRVRTLMTNLSATEYADYDLFKARIIAEHAISPAMYKQYFDDAKRQSGESLHQFASRTRCLLQAYLKSRAVTTYEDLVNLLLMDKLKTQLTTHAKFVVTEKESLMPGYTVEQACKILELLEVEHGKEYVNFTPYKSNTYGNWKHSNNSYNSQANSQTNGKQSYQNANSSNPHQTNAKNQGSHQDQRKQPFQMADKSKMRCHNCGILGHLKNTCRLPMNTGERPKRVNRVWQKRGRHRGSPTNLLPMLEEYR